MAKKIYNKLVRDKIPRIMHSNGHTNIATEFLDDEKFEIALSKKLKEEVEEFVEKPCIEKYADIMSVMFEISDFYNISIEKVSGYGMRKEEEQGGYHDRIFLISAEVKEDETE